MPARNEVRNSAGFKALKDQSTIATQINDLHFPPPLAGIGDALTEFYKGVTEAVNGKDPQKAMSDAAGRTDQVLAANVKKYG